METVATPADSRAPLRLRVRHAWRILTGRLTAAALIEQGYRAGAAAGREIARVEATADAAAELRTMSPARAALLVTALDRIVTPDTPAPAGQRRLTLVGSTR